MKPQLSIIILLFIAFSSQVKAQKGDKIQWYSFEEAIKESKVHGDKKIFVDVYTDWCGWCKKMDKTTFQDPDVIKIMNQYFYPVKFNAESKKTIKFQNMDFKFISNGTGGYHELAAALLEGQMSYPSSVLLDENQALIQPIPGFMKAKVLCVILEYIGTDAYKNTDWEQFQKEYKVKNQ